jgi:hypothetical protein
MYDMRTFKDLMLGVCSAMLVLLTIELVTLREDIKKLKAEKRCAGYLEESRGVYK